MRNVYIKYNPYLERTIIRIHECTLASDGRLMNHPKRLQDWVEDLPDMLFEECGTKDFNIIFSGTDWDFEDVAAVVEASKTKGFNIMLEHIPFKEIDKGEQGVDELLDVIQNSQIEELKDSDVVSAYEEAKKSEIEIYVNWAGLENGGHSGTWCRYSMTHKENDQCLWMHCLIIRR